MKWQTKVQNARAFFLTTGITLVAVNFATAQNIVGDTILVSADTQTWLTFNSPPNGQVTKDASSFSITGTGKSLAIEPTKPPTKTTTLIVQEGSRTHQFVVYYKEDIDPSQSVYNFSDLKQIEKRNKDKATTKDNEPVAAAQPAPAKPANDKPAVSREAQDFALAIATGDEAYDKQQYAEAKVAYEKALSIKGNNDYAKARLASIEKAFADKERLAAQLRDDNYNNALLKAAKAFTNKNFAEAKASYKDALESRPNDAFAMNQIVAIDKVIADEAVKARQAETKKQQEETYKTTIASADKANAAGDFVTAKSYYSLASSYKPDETYPRKKMEEIDKKISDQAKQKEIEEREKLYNNTISKAKAAYDTRNFDMSKDLYNQALNLKPGDEFSRTQIKAIDKAIASEQQKALDEKKSMESEAAFKEAMTLADNAFKAENYDVALTEYTKALDLKNDNRAENQIKTINDILQKEKEKALSEKEKQAREAQRNNNYDQAMKKAESLFTKKDYANASIAYKQALNYKDEQQPKDRLAEIDSLQNELAAKNNLEKEKKAQEEDAEKKYTLAIQKAKALELNNDFDNAKIAYLEALQAKPSDVVVKARIEALDKKVTAVETDKKYDAAIAAGNIAIGDRKYDDALASFKDALKLKPLETYPLKQISYVESVMTKANTAEKETKEKEVTTAGEAIRIQSFNDAMSSYKRADTALSQRRWQDALVEYENFIRLIPDPKELNNYQFNTAGTIEFAKRKIIDLRNYLNRQKGSTYQSDAITYTPDDLSKKYPDVDFAQSPQPIIGPTDKASLASAAKDVAAETPRLSLADSANGIKVTCVNITQTGEYTYFKFKILNSTSTDFLTGDMHISTTRKKKNVPFEPVYVTAYPVVLPGKEFSIVYGCKPDNIASGENLVFQLNDRKKNPAVQLTIPGSALK